MKIFDNIVGIFISVAGRIAVSIKLFEGEENGTETKMIWKITFHSFLSSIVWFYL